MDKPIEVEVRFPEGPRMVPADPETFAPLPMEGWGFYSVMIGWVAEKIEEPRPAPVEPSPAPVKEPQPVTTAEEPMEPLPDNGIRVAEGQWYRDGMGLLWMDPENLPEEDGGRVFRLFKGGSPGPRDFTAHGRFIRSWNKGGEIDTTRESWNRASPNDLVLQVDKVEMLTTPGLEAVWKEHLNRLVKKHGGWWEGDIARFPSVAAKENFEREMV